MKKTLWLMITYLLINNIYYAQIPYNGMFAYYKFNGNANDEKGVKHASVVGATLTEDRFSNQNSAYSLDGVDDYIQLPNDLMPPSLTAFTISGWIKPNGNNSTPGNAVEAILDLRKQYVILLSWVQDLGSNSSTSQRIGAYLNNVSILSNPNSVLPGSWYHIAAVYDGSQLSLYLNNFLVGSVATGSPAASSLGTSKLGKNYDTAQPVFWFNGCIDDFRFYLVALSASEISQLFNEPNSGLSSGGGTTESVWIKNTNNDIYYQDGNVAIGTDNMETGYMLKVNGAIKAKEVNVTTNNFPDYVFEESYELKSIENLEKYINENKHLPNIPSATEVKESGISVGEMQAKLLQKIEELTLYIIQIKKEYAELKKIKKNK